MGRHDWYRNEEWNKEIAEAYFAKLDRAREKNQYLRIQAVYLKKSHPEIALDLLEKYFELDGDFFDCASALTLKAEIFLVMGDIENAITAYEHALEKEATNENFRTEAAVVLPILFIEHNLTHHFAKGIKILENNTEYVPIPVNNFRWNAAMAIFKDFIGEKSEASKHAELALSAAKEIKSGFRYHQKLGIVDNKHESMIESLRSILS